MKQVQKNLMTIVTIVMMIQVVQVALTNRIQTQTIMNIPLMVVNRYIIVIILDKSRIE